MNESVTMSAGNVNRVLTAYPSFCFVGHITIAKSRYGVFSHGQGEGYLQVSMSQPLDQFTVLNGKALPRRYQDAIEHCQPVHGNNSLARSRVHVAKPFSALLARDSSALAISIARSVFTSVDPVRSGL